MVIRKFGNWTSEIFIGEFIEKKAINNLIDNNVREFGVRQSSCNIKKKLKIYIKLLIK
jgi:hypothetical protein